MAKYQNLDKLYGDLARVRERMAGDASHAEKMSLGPQENALVSEIHNQGGNPNRSNDELMSLSKNPAQANQAPPEPNKPIYPTIESWLTGTGEGETPGLRKGLSLVDTFDPETAGYDAFKQYALAKPGESAWEKLQMQSQGLEEQGARDAAGRTAATGRTTAYSDLARTGGLGKGARERIGRQSTLDLALRNQGIMRDAAQRRLGISTGAEERRVGAMGQFGTMEQNRNIFEAKRKEADINRILQQKRLEDAAKMNRYNEEMEAWAAGKQAEATEASGK